MIKVSVIMPVYNSEEYLSLSIPSVLNQSLQELELLLIDDGSTDRSGEICEEYAKKDARVRVFHKKNGGICDTRNYGIARATGEYIAFIDNDDAYTPDNLKRHYELAKRHRADVVKYGCHIEETFPGGKTAVREYVFPEFQVFQKEKALEQYRDMRKYRYFGTIWNGIYRREFIEKNQLRFNTRIKTGYEDWVLNFQLYVLADIQVVDTEIGYLYYQRYDHSTAKKFNWNQVESLVLCAKEERKLYLTLDPAETVLDDWMQKATEYVVEVLLTFEKAGCTATEKEKAAFLHKMHNTSIFQDIAGYRKGGDMSIQRKLVAKWFWKEQYARLLCASKLFAMILHARRKAGKS